MSQHGFQLKSTEDLFYELCKQNPDLRLERTSEGKVIVMPPTGRETGSRNDEITRQLGNWRKENGRGRSFDSSTGFKLPNGADRAPDASWVKKSRLAQLTLEEKKSFCRSVRHKRNFSQS